ELEVALPDCHDASATRSRWRGGCRALAGDRDARHGPGGGCRRFRAGERGRRSRARLHSHVRWPDTLEGIRIMARKRYIQAINEALFEEMERDPKVILFGEDVELAIMGDCRGLADRFGRDRIRNTPICEQTLTGMAVGASAAGHRVILHLMFSNFIYTGMDAIGNQMAKMRLMSGGQARLPITVIASYGGGGSNAAQHSDTAYPPLLNLGGINVLTPATPADAKGLLKTAIRGNNPTFFMEAGGRGGEQGEVPEGEYLVPFGKANIVRTGKDLTLVAIGSMLKPALAAAKALASEGIDTEVIDPRTLVPFDSATVLESVRHTG